MAEVYDSDRPIVLLDMVSLRPYIDVIGDLSACDFDYTFLLNDMLHFSANVHTGSVDMARFLQENLIEISKAYSSFAIALRKEKLRSFAAIATPLRTLNLNLTQFFVRNGLYNHGGILQIDTVDATDLNCVVALKDNSKWTQDYKNRPIYSTSGISLEYLEKTLFSV